LVPLFINDNEAFAIENRSTSKLGV